MKRRDVITLLAGAAAAWPLRALAQSPAKVYRVGLLGLADNRSPYEAPLIRGLALHGYAVDRNLAIERRGGRWTAWRNSSPSSRQAKSRSSSP